MKTKIFILLATVSFLAVLTAQDAKRMYIMKDGKITYEVAVSDIDSIIFYDPVQQELCHCIMDTLKGEWSWVEEGNMHVGCNDIDHFKSIIKILSQNEDNSINYEIFVEDTLFSRGSFLFQKKVDIILPHGGQRGTGPCGGLWTTSYNPATPIWGNQERLRFSDGCFEGCDYAYERIR